MCAGFLFIQLVDCDPQGAQFYCRLVALCLLILQLPVLSVSVSGRSVELSLQVVYLSSMQSVDGAADAADDADDAADADAVSGWCC